MDFRQLEVFQAAARSGGFTRASQELHLSQSTVSQHIKQLEDELGCPLFLRVGKRVLVSEAGQVLLQYAERIFRDLKHAEMAVRDLSSLKRGTVRLGTGATTLAYRLPGILREYKRRFPEIDLVVVAETTEFLLAQVKSHQIDLAIVMSPVPSPGLTITPLGVEEMVVLLDRKHPLARKTVLTANDLATLRFIFYPKHTAMQDAIDRYFELLGVTPQVAMEVENVEAMKSLARAGLGASILPFCAVGERGQAAHLRVLRVKGLAMVRELGLVTLDAAMLPRATRELAAALVAGLAG